MASGSGTVGQTKTLFVTIRKIPSDEPIEMPAGWNFTVTSQFPNIVQVMTQPTKVVKNGIPMLATQVKLMAKGQSTLNEVLKDQTGANRATEGSTMNVAEAPPNPDPGAVRLDSFFE